jgi:hypothetical protein
LTTQLVPANFSLRQTTSVQYARRPSPAQKPQRMKPHRLLAFFATAAMGLAAPVQTKLWVLAPDGGITWTPKREETHTDSLEMTGQKVSVIVTYGVDETGRFTVSRQVVWPMLRFQPNETRDQLALTFTEDAMPKVYADRRLVRNETTTEVHFDGVLQARGVVGRQGEIAFVRTIFPSAVSPAVFDRTVFTNRSNHDIVFEVDDNERTARTNPARGIYGGYVARAKTDGTGERTVHPGESTDFTIVMSAQKLNEAPLALDITAEEQGRRARVERVQHELVLATPDPILNTAFAFAKIRATESIFATKSGLLHSPGGGEYYAGIWANDQAEYSGPFFAMLDDPTAREAGLNAYRLFATYVNPDYKPIPSSIVSEGANTWHGAGDRGDMAMIAYGASRYALARGDEKTAAELWPLIEWCLEYCRRKVTADGVVASDADELENRFPSGTANLCTSSLYYDALHSALLLGRDLGKSAAQLEAYAAQAKAMRAAIDRYFGANVEGFETYRYFDKKVPSVNAGAAKKHAHYANEPDHLRAWICVPLTMGIYDRAPATIDALFSPRLWTADGLATEAGKETFWDRSTLYALRGVFAAGETQRALDFLSYYSTRRLLGNHVPYPVEAYPEGNQRHLSAESALYCRIYTEGMFGLRPTGLHSFEVTPRLPKAWPMMALRSVHAFGEVFNLTVTRDAQKLRVDIARDGKPTITQLIDDGATAAMKF